MNFSYNVHLNINAFVYCDRRVYSLSILISKGRYM
jgi:hypothetical protein